MILIDDSSFPIHNIYPYFIDSIFINGIELNSSRLLCKTVTRGESRGTETKYDI